MKVIKEDLHATTSLFKLVSGHGFIVSQGRRIKAFMAQTLDSTISRINRSEFT